MLGEGVTAFGEGGGRPWRESLLYFSPFGAILEIIKLFGKGWLSC